MRRLAVLDGIVVLYLALPVAIFLVGWLEPWAAVPLMLCLVYALRPLALPERTQGFRPRISGWQVAIALFAGCAWTLAGGIGHWVFANADWHIRDAVLHDLVAGTWPVGYGAEDGSPTLLRAPIGYYLPAALIGKMAGLGAANAALAAWTAAGVSLFLLQVLSQIPGRAAAALASVAVIVCFSGLDAVGTVLRVPGALAHWDVTRHLEWWADRYQYSSMTTQLFWVPNHALGAWLGVGLLYRLEDEPAAIPVLAPVVAVVSLWSPLAALGLVPFVLWQVFGTALRERSSRLFHPRIWAPALAVGLAIAAYLTLDAGQIPKGWTLGRQGFGAAALGEDLWRQAEFFLLEAGLIGFAILAVRRSAFLALALWVLALLPVVRFGAANDIVMRASIPSLTVLAIGACLALFAAPRANLGIRKAVLAGLLCIGAITPLQEIARAAALDPWPADRKATLIDAACGVFPPHYVARLRGQLVTRLLEPPHALSIGQAGSSSCANPALRLERERLRAEASR